MSPSPDAAATPTSAAAPDLAPPAAAPARRRALWPYALAVVLLVAGGAGAWALLSPSTVGPRDPALDGPLAVVTRGTLVVSVTETGEVMAEKRTVISNEIQWPVIIQWLVDEGELVKKGEKIIVFECKELEDAIEGKRLDVTQARNSYLQALENVALDQKEQDNLLRKSDLAVEDANSDLRRYLEAAGPVSLSDANAAINTARRDLALAEEKLNFKLKVNADKELNSPFSENEIEAEKLSVQKLVLALQKAISNYRMLVKYDDPREIRKLKEAVEDAKLALARAKHTARSKMLTSEADRDTKKIAFDMKSKQLTEMLDDANKLIITAEEEGLVVYDTGGSRWRPNNVVVEVGAKISPRQQLMIIPDMTTLMIQTKVYEALIDQVRPGLEAFVRFDAQPDRAVRAHVSKVAVLPDSQHHWLNPGVKVFKVDIELDEKLANLKPGTSAQVEIQLDRLADVLSVPVAAVFTEQEKTFCFRPNGGEPQRVEVEIGRMNETRVQVLSGLAEGDTVLLTPPASIRTDRGNAKEEDDEEPDDLQGPPPDAGGPTPGTERRGAPRPGPGAERRPGTGGRKGGGERPRGGGRPGGGR